MTFVALITGGGTGIGRAQALALSKVEDSAVVIITGRRLEPLVATQKEIGPEKCHVVADCDAGSTDAWKRIVAKVEELGGKLHFLGNTVGGTGTTVQPYEAIHPEEMIAYNTSYITSVQLSYHYMAPFLSQGAADRGKPSVVMDMSSAAAISNRGIAWMLPMYLPCKVAMNAITRVACGLYKEKGIVTYGIDPFCYLTDMLREGALSMGLTSDQYANLVNPFDGPGDPADLGHLSIAAAMQEMDGIESGASYCMFPIPPKYRDETDPERTGSVLYNVTAHGAGMDGLDVDDLRVALTKIKSAYYSNGKKVPEHALRKIVAGIEEARQNTVQAAASSA
jgi:NAD(P)-dependent dehydrogenase (short-subunit alcohol dehydrogenase family)